MFDGTELLETTVEVALYPNDNLLCVAHLPFNLDDTDFLSMASEYGAIERCFLMRSHAGKSKGYGFVEFMHNKEKSNQARLILNGKKVGSCVLHCDFLSDCMLRFPDLHSRCLYVNHLPPNYTNASELQNIFSRIIQPKYFQLAVREGESLGFAVVEYADAQEAEQTQSAVNGHQVDNYNIRVTFCVPGQAASQVYARLINDHVGRGLSKTGLLPNPGGVILPNNNNNNNYNNVNNNSVNNNINNSSLSESLTNPAMYALLAQTPQLLQNFQIVLQQLEKSQQAQHNLPKPGLLGIAPNMPANPLMNPNLQVALLAVLLAIQLQQAQPSLIGNPLLQQMINANLANQNRPGMSQSKPSLLGNPLIAQANAMLQGLFSQTSPTTAQPASTQQPAGMAKTNQTLLSAQLGTGTTASFPFLNANLPDININMLNNFTQLLSLLQGAGNPGSTVAPQLSPPAGSGAGPRPGLLGDAPHSHKPGLLGDRPGNPKQGLLGTAPPNKPLLNTPVTNAQSQPMFNQNSNTASQNANTQPKVGLLGDVPPGTQGLPNLGPANPLLALFLENQIKQHLQQVQGHTGARSNGQKAPLLKHPQFRPAHPNGNQPGVQQGKPSKPLLPHPHQHLNQQPFTKTPGRRGLLGDQPGASTPLDLPDPERKLQDDSDDNASTCSNGSHKSGQFKTPSILKPPGIKKGLLGDKPISYKAEVAPSSTYGAFYGRKVTGSSSNHVSAVNEFGRNVQRDDNYNVNGSQTQHAVNVAASIASNGSSATSASQALTQYQTATSKAATYKPNTLVNSMLTQPPDVSSSQPTTAAGSVYNYAAYDYQNQVYATNLQAQQLQGQQQLSANWTANAGQLADGLATTMGYGAASLGWDTNNVLAYQQMYQQYVAQQQGIMGYQLMANMGVAGQYGGQAGPAAAPTAGPAAVILPQVAALPTVMEPPPASVASATPIGRKRKPHLLPSPEASPEGIYIGQHSQGLGGHYAESYIKKRKLQGTSF